MTLHESPIYSVGSLVTELRSRLENHYRSIWVTGEVSGLSKPASGHLYFSLKEHQALIRCAFFRQRRLHSVMPEEGMQVLLKGQISVYANRGDLQLIVHYLEPAGEGALRRQFEMLKRKLQAEGLFDPTHKKPLPAYPATIGVITSPSGAALRDILVTLKRRFPLARVIVYPVSVQGDSAPGEITGMLHRASENPDIDVLILARGGGSLEDLQAFNDEPVARAMHRCVWPIVSGVGHETDITIADLVADYRAATPTAAAEAVTPLASAILQHITQQRSVLLARMIRHLDDLGQRVDHATSRLVHPLERLRRNQLELDGLQRRIHHQVQVTLVGLERLVAERRNIVRQHNPAQWLRLLRERRQYLMVRIDRASTQRLVERRQSLHNLIQALRLLGPDRTLARGYAILRNRKRRVIGSVSHTQAGEKLTALLSDGTLTVRVDGD